VTRRQVGRRVAGIAAAVAFLWAAWSAQSAAMPEFKVYDGFWMMLGAAIAVLLVAPLVWGWPRERSLLVIVIASVLGSIIPLAISAFTHRLPLMARLKGSWLLAGADLVGPALVIGFACLWFALRDEAPGSAP
jgi:hypothetical protein